PRGFFRSSATDRLLRLKVAKNPAAKPGSLRVLARSHRVGSLLADGCLPGTMLASAEGDKYTFPNAAISRPDGSTGCLGSTVRGGLLRSHCPSLSIIGRADHAIDPHPVSGCICRSGR